MDYDRMFLLVLRVMGVYFAVTGIIRLPAAMPFIGDGGGVVIVFSAMIAVALGGFMLFRASVIVALVASLDPDRSDEG